MPTCPCSGRVFTQSDALVSSAQSDVGIAPPSKVRIMKVCRGPRPYCLHLQATRRGHGCAGHAAIQRRMRACLLAGVVRGGIRAERLTERVALNDLLDAVHAGRQAEELAKGAVRAGGLRDGGVAARKRERPASEPAPKTAAEITRAAGIGLGVGIGI